jgi:2'-5' RNA ligase
LDELDRLKPEPLEFTAEEVILFKSDLRPTGAVYTPLQRLPRGSKKTEEQS